jgi:hypothetical protein
MGFNSAFNDLYSLPNIVRVIKSSRMRWMEHVARIGRRGAYRVLVGRSKGKRPLGKPRHRRKNNIKVDLQKVGCGTMDRIIWLMTGTGGGHL